jgi:hypothetical protein
MTSAGVDRELLAVLVALEPLDDRKWDYLDLQQRTFHSERMLQEPWSSGERTLIDVAASLWNTGTVDLGYIACALGGRHLQAVLDATAIRAGHDLTSNVSRAVARISQESRRPPAAARRSAQESPVHGLGDNPPVDRQVRGLGR